MEFFPENISSFGDSIDGLWKLVTIISVIVFLIDLVLFNLKISAPERRQSGIY